MKNNVKLYLGDSKDILKQLEDNSVDMICTDPPYGYSFMGKGWDKVLPSIEIWKECLRVLKPGAFAFVMSAPRQDVMSRMMIKLEDAGFRVDFSSIYWAYATGFPKASNIGKIVDKRLGVKGKKIKAGGVGFMNESDDGYHTTKHQIIMPERQTKEAKLLDGSYGGFQPKPAVEIIIVAMKPLSEKTYVDQALKNGKGITWLDAVKVPYESEDNIVTKNLHTHRENSKAYTEIYGEYQPSSYKLPKGRFPANLIVSDNVLNDGKISKSVPHTHNHKKETLIYGNGKGLGIRKKDSIYNDKGSFSRYFDLDKWWNERINKLPENVKKVFPFLITPKASKREKNKGLLEKGTGSNTYNKKCLNCGKWQRKQGLTDDYTCYCEQPNWEKPKGNIHPTVKPIKLMSYLITLGSREEDVVLDPFMGSGSTGISAKLLNRKFIGMELSEEYMKIAMARIKGH